jgi:2-succinyl-5-enolpyruvyl-6-hydroxy-3-cyclohexene-1-carboxylate synthase
VNNGCGTEFNLYSHYGSQFGEHTNDYIAAGGHNGQMSPDLVRHYATDLGFNYLSARTKEEFAAAASAFLDPKSEMSIVFECFTNVTDESEALRRMCSIIPHKTIMKDVVKAVLPQGVKNAIKGIIH